MTPPNGEAGTKRGTSQGVGTSGKDVDIEIEETGHDKEHKEHLSNVGVSKYSPFVVKMRPRKKKKGG